MQKFLIISVLSLALGLYANGGTIIISTSDNVVLTVPPVPGSLSGIGSAAVGIPLNPLMGVDGVGEVSISILGAQASASGPVDLSQPLTLTANGQVNMPGLETSAYNFTVVPSSAVMSEYLFPSISLNYAPDGLLGYASIQAYQEVEDPTNGNNELLSLQVQFSGGGNGSFTFDPSTNLMSLVAPVGGSGYIYLSSSGNASGGPVLIFEFLNGGIFESYNNLGLTIPNALDFSVTVDPFQFSFPGFSDFTYNTTDALIQEASLTAPEPATAWLIVSGIAALAAKIRLSGISAKKKVRSS
jgi:hypothetical protein